MDSNTKNNHPEWIDESHLKTLIHDAKMQAKPDQLGQAI